MTLDSLTQVLVKLGSRKDGNALVTPDGSDVTVLVALEGETLQVSKITRVVEEHGLIVVATGKNEHFAFPLEAVLAVKVDRSDAARRDRGGAGFMK